MNILDFIKKNLPIRKLDFEEDFLLIKLDNVQKFTIKFLDNSMTSIICDSIDFCNQNRILYFNCNDYCILRRNISGIRDVRVVDCSQDEYRQECMRLEELFV